MRKKDFKAWSHSITLLFIPLIIAGGRLVTRVVLNLWDFIEGGGRNSF